jgi:hypothetical protein
VISCDRSAAETPAWRSVSSAPLGAFVENGPMKSRLVRAASSEVIPEGS